MREQRLAKLPRLRANIGFVMVSNDRMHEQAPVVAVFELSPRAFGTLGTLSLQAEANAVLGPEYRSIGIKKSASFRKECGDRVEPLGTSTRLIGEPVGTEKMWGGCMYVKVDAKGSWQPKHVIIWRSHYGEYNGRSHCLWFIDRNPANCDITNLELITRKESANRTSIFQYPKDLREAIVLHNKLKRRIREQH